MRNSGVMRRLVVLALLAGCGGKAATRPPARTPYLILFEQGRTWTLPAATGAVTCKVAQTKQVGDAMVSRLDCGSLLVSGTWVSTPAGLYHPYLPVDDPDELALLDEDDLLLARIPEEREHSRALDGGAQDSIEAFAYEGSWCVRQTTQSPSDRRTYTLCFDGTHITGGGEDTASGGGAAQRITFGTAPPETSAPDQEESVD